MQQISYYISAGDNIGSQVTVKAAVDMIRSGLQGTTKEYRTKYLPPVAKAQQHFDAQYVRDVDTDRWKSFVKLRNLVKSLEQKEKSKPGQFTSQLATAKENIATQLQDEWIKTTQELEGVLNKEKDIRDDYKTKKFPAVIWSGLFDKRAIAGLRLHSNLICIDIDKLTQERHDTLKKLLQNDSHIHILFTSPSGVGLKLIFKINNDAPHLQFFQNISEYLAREYQIQADPSGKDVSRLCFLCNDSHVYYNPDSSVFYAEPVIPQALPVVPPQADIPAISKDEKKAMAGTADELESLFDVHEFTENKLAYIEGQRNRFLYLFCCNACRKGFDKEDTRTHCFNNYSDRSAAEINQTVEKAYTECATEFGKFKKGSKKKQYTYAPVLPAAETHKTAADKKPKTGNTPTTQFWYTYVKTDKESGKTKTVTEIDIKKLVDFIEELGYYVYEQEDGYQYIYVTGRRVKVVNFDMLKRGVMKYIKFNCPDEVYSLILRGNKSHLGEDKLSGLTGYPIDVKRDNSACSYFYFNNCVVHVSAADITIHNYETLTNHIWANQVNKRDFTRQDFNYINDFCFNQFEAWPSEFAKYVRLVAHNPKAEEEADLPQEEVKERFEAFCSSLGYLLDSNKHPADRKGIFAIDHRVSDKNESNGRTGKSLFVKACSFLKVVSTISGGTYDPKYQFRFEPINIDTQIINFNDVKPNVDVREMFELIADDYEVNKRNTGRLFFKYEESAKVYASMNGLPKGDGESYRGRMHVLEFSDFFNAGHTPFNYFGHALFNDEAWTPEQWNHTFNFLIGCVKLYKGKGLVPYPNGNFNLRRMRSECPPEFIDFIEALEESTQDFCNMPRDQWTDKKTFIKLWNEEAAAYKMQSSSAKHVLSMLKAYCKARTFFLFERNSNNQQKYFMGTQMPPDYINKTVKCHVGEEAWRERIQAAKGGKLL